jgi:5-methylcytosine-specific restriction endonuclease McrA
LEKTGQKRTKYNLLWRKWASNCLGKQRIRSGADCGLSIDELLKITPSHCPCCKNVMIPMQGKIHNSPTVDRLDPDKGYEVNNIWIICHQCNNTKGRHKSPAELYRIADAWYLKIERKKILNASNNSTD